MAEAEGDEEEAEARRRGVSERLVAQRRAERGDASTSAVADDSSTEAEAIRSKMQGKNEKNSTQKANFLGEDTTSNQNWVQSPIRLLTASAPWLKFHPPSSS